MATKALLCSIAACLICACAQMPGTPPPGPPPGAKPFMCGGASCDVKVSVTCNPDYLGLLCRIEADPEWISVPKGNKPVIKWEVVTSGYVFFASGISFPSDSGFTCHSEGTKKFMCNDDHKPGTYKYTITLFGVPFVWPYDPWVDNQ